MSGYRVISKSVVFKKGEDDSLSMCQTCSEGMGIPELDQYIEVDGETQARIYLFKTLATYDVESEKEALDQLDKDGIDVEPSLCYHCQEGIIGPEFVDLIVEKE